MAQKKTKSDKTPSNDDETTLILDYLRKQNRPYSAVDVSANLHNKVNKAHAVKVLRELHQKKEIEGRVAGKQTVYHAVQDASDEATPEAAEAMDEKIKQLQEQLTGLKSEEKKARAELASLCAKPLCSELRHDIGHLEQENEAILGRLAQIRGNGSVNVSPEEKADIEKEWKRCNNHANTRWRICRDLWKNCSEVVPENMTRGELWESLGLDGDALD